MYIRSPITLHYFVETDGNCTINMYFSFWSSSFYHFAILHYGITDVLATIMSLSLFGVHTSYIWYIWYNTCHPFTQLNRGWTYAHFHICWNRLSWLFCSYVPKVCINGLPLSLTRFPAILCVYTCIFVCMCLCVCVYVYMYVSVEYQANEYYYPTWPVWSFINLN
jgi:hypothetical protein